ncbi:maintenance of telomere capping protein 1 [Ganoderma leucocontextum]|nr:maintenance of telomere capping protein 1 [Ganoderma leucocontextum]
MSKSKSKQQEALQFLDDLDNLAPPEAAGAPPPSSAQPGSTQPGSTEGEAEVFAFIDEITQKSSEPPRPSVHIDRPLSRAGTPTVRKSTERVKVGTPTPLLPGSVPLSRTESSSSRVSVGPSSRQDASPQAQEAQTPASAPLSSGGGWGWGSVWSTASTALQQARTVVDEQVKNLPKNEQARKWGEGVLEYAKNAQLDKLGQDFKRVGLSTLTDILNVVAPPISEHEVIQVWLSHDMQGYAGIESLVYRALSRIMEQVEGGDLVVNRGDEARTKDAVDGKRDLNAVEGYDAALKLSQANLEELIKRNVKPEQPPASTTQNPTTYSYVYLRVQPFSTTYALPQISSGTETPASSSSTTQSSLHFLISLSDPHHNLIHSTVTQSVPAKWLDVWDEYDWVEDLVVEAIRIGVEVVGQEYIGQRMGWDGKKEKQPAVEQEPAAEKAAS